MQDGSGTNHSFPEMVFDVFEPSTFWIYNAICVTKYTSHLQVGSVPCGLTKSFSKKKKMVNAYQDIFNEGVPKYMF
jgi:hypothetical protein